MENKTHTLCFPYKIQYSQNAQYSVSPYRKELSSFSFFHKTHTTIFVALEPSPQCQGKYFIRNAKANNRYLKQMWFIVFSLLLFSEVVRITAQFKMQLQTWQQASILSEFDPDSFMLFFWETHPFSNIRIPHHHFLPTLILPSHNLIGRLINP